jgi:hypothetical protein
MLKWIEISEFTFTTSHDNRVTIAKMGRDSLSIKSVQIYPSIANLR